MTYKIFAPDGSAPIGDIATGGIVAQVSQPGATETTSIPLLPNSWVSLEQARVFMDEDNDFLLAMALQTATSLVKDYLAIDYLQQVTTEIYKTKNNHKIFLNRGLINSISNISRLSVNEQNTIATIPNTQFYFDDKFVTILGGGQGYSVSLNEPQLFSPYNVYSITYDAGYVLTPTAGYTLMPQALQMAITIVAKAIIMARTNDPNVAGENAAGAYSMQYLVQTTGGISPSTMMMLNFYRRTAKW